MAKCRRVLACSFGKPKEGQVRFLCTKKGFTNMELVSLLKDEEALNRTSYEKQEDL